MRILLACAGLALAAAAYPAAAAAEPPAITSSLTGAMLYVTDPEREVAFYRDALGMTLAMTLDHGSKREYMLRFSADRSLAGIILLHDSAADAPAKLEFGNAFVRLVLRVSDMDALSARLDGLGIAHAAPRDAGHGYRMMMLTDPEGYRLEIIQSAPAATEHKP
jgi:lactoylglutathione lyase